MQGMSELVSCSSQITGVRSGTEDKTDLSRDLALPTHILKKTRCPYRCLMTAVGVAKLKPNACRSDPFSQVAV